ncbi:MAG: ABC transporter substrate-binding protein [Anaerovoracaceae bacterium]
MTKIKRILTIGLAIIMVLSMTACGETDKKTAKGGKDLEEFNLVLDWYPNAIHCFLFNAIEKGYYEEEGLKLNIQYPSNTNDGISLPAAGKADMGIYYMQYIIEAKAAQDIAIKSVGSITQSQLGVIMSLAESNIKGPKDLIGKKIGSSGSAINEAILKSMIEHEGGTVDQIDLIDVGFDVMSSLTTKNVDAGMGAMINHEIVQLQHEGFDVNYFNPTDFGIPNSYEMSFVTGEKQLKEDRDKLERFMRATKKGFEYMKSNPEDSLQIMLSHQNEENFPLTEAVERKSLEVLLPVMETKDGPFMYQDEKIWEDNIQWMYKNKLIKKKIKVSDVMENLDY